MHKKKLGGISKKFLMLAVVVVGVVVMIFSAAAATSLYQNNTDEFTSALGKNLAALCSDSDFSLSRTQLRMIECADIKKVEYQTTSDGQKQFYAEIRLINPKINCGSYSGDKPEEYLAEAAESLFDNKWNYVSCNIVGLCIDDKPVIDAENLERLISCVEESWNNGKNILENKHVVSALIDALCPEPFKDRQYSDGTDYTIAYSRFLDNRSVYFASEGIKVNGEKSTKSPVIRDALTKIITPYLCSADNPQLSSSSDSNGILTMTFNSLNIVQSISEAKSSIVSSSDISESEIQSTIFSAVVLDISNYSEDKAITNKIDIDFIDFMSGSSYENQGYYAVLQAIVEYYGNCTDDITNCGDAETVTSCKIIGGSSSGQWPVEFKRNTGDGDVIIDVIKVNDNGRESSIMKLYLVDGGSQIVCLERGNYRLNIAVGTNYFGSEQLFGDDGIYFKTDDIIDISSGDIPSITIKKRSEESFSLLDYMLDKNSGGTCIDKSDF